MKVNTVDAARNATAHLSNWRQPIYQHICPAAFRRLLGFNELKEKLFIRRYAAVDDRYRSCSFTDKQLSFDADLSVSTG